VTFIAVVVRVATAKGSFRCAGLLHGLHSGTKGTAGLELQQLFDLMRMYHYPVKNLTFSAYYLNSKHFFERTRSRPLPYSRAITIKPVVYSAPLMLFVHQNLQNITFHGHTLEE